MCSLNGERNRGMAWGEKVIELVGVHVYLFVCVFGHFCKTNFMCVSKLHFFGFFVEIHSIYKFITFHFSLYYWPIWFVAIVYLPLRNCSRFKYFVPISCFIYKCTYTFEWWRTSELLKTVQFLFSLRCRNIIMSASGKASKRKRYYAIERERKKRGKEMWKYEFTKGFLREFCFHKLFHWPLFFISFSSSSLPSSLSLSPVVDAMCMLFA